MLAQLQTLPIEKFEELSEVIFAVVGLSNLAELLRSIVEINLN